MAISRNTKTGGGTSVNGGAVWNADDINPDMDTLFNKFNTGILNADVAAGAGIVYSKLNLAGSVLNTDIVAAAGIPYSKLTLTGAVLNADIAAAAGIPYSKLTLASSLVTADVAATGLAVSKLDTPFQIDNGLTNGFFQWWQREPAASGFSVANGVDTYVADRWAIEPAGAACTVTRQTAGLNSSSVGDVGIELIGAASVTSIELTQRIPRSVCRRLGALLANQNVTFSAKIIHSGTTGTITPTLIVRSTSNTGDDTTATKFANANMTQRLSQAFTGVTTTQESTLSHTFDLGAMTDSQNGLELSLSFAAMSAGTQKIIVSDIFLIRGSVAPFLLIQPDEDSEMRKCHRFYRKTFDFATKPAQSAGFVGTITMRQDDANNCAMPWQHGPMMRSAGTLITYNPSAADTGSRSTDNTTTKALISSSAGQQNSYAIFTGSAPGTPQQTFHAHMTLECEYYD